MVDLGGRQVISLLVNFGPGASPMVKRWKTLVTHISSTICAIRLKFCRMAESCHLQAWQACAKFGTI